MRAIVRTLAAIVAMLGGILAAPSCLAQLVDPSIAGRWAGSSGGIVATLVLSERATFSGTLSGRRLDGCEFEGVLPRIRVSDSTAFRASGAARLAFCDDRDVSGPYSVSIVATPAALTMEFTPERGRGGFEVQRMSRVLGAGAAPNPVSIDSDIAGHWRGMSGSITADLDLTTGGHLSAQLSGGGKDGCTFSGTIDEDGVLQNTRRDFGAIAGVEMSGCSDASLNGSQAVIVTAAAGTRRIPGTLGFAFIDADDEDEFLFKVEGLRRTGPATVLGAGPSFDLAITGSWGGRALIIAGDGGDGEATLTLDIAVNGAISGSFSRSGCVVTGSVVSSEPDSQFAGDVIWHGTVTISGCTPRAATFNRTYDMEISASPPFRSSVVTLAGRARAGSGSFLVIVGLMGRD